jgi:predicted nucleotide-binding protein
MARKTIKIKKAKKDETLSILAPGLPDPTRSPRQIFVAYSYKLYPKDDYRKVYSELAKAFQVKFIFADEKITNLHILQKIVNYIRSSRFGIYDISGWNPNVTLELGLAFGLNEKAYIAIDPAKTKVDEVPADLRGIDRIQYNSYSELQKGLETLLAQELPLQRSSEMENQLQELRVKAIEVVSQADGLKIPDIAKVLGISTDLAKLVVKPLVGDVLRMKGVKRGAKYYKN